ncbi:hypothetical protein NQ314_006570, partial [Rhamnusium bicolor]
RYLATGDSFKTFFVECLKVQYLVLFVKHLRRYMKLYKNSFSLVTDSVTDESAVHLALFLARLGNTWEHCGVSKCLSIIACESVDWLEFGVPIILFEDGSIPGVVWDA